MQHAESFQAVAEQRGVRPQLLGFLKRSNGSPEVALHDGTDSALDMQIELGSDLCGKHGPAR